MKKTLLLMIAALFALSVTGQPVTKKAQVTGSQKLQELEKLQNLLVTAQKLDSTITESGDGSPWVFSNRIKYSYSVVGFTTTATSQKNLSATGNAWVNQDKTETTVDGLGNTTQIVDYTWSGSAWVGSMKIEFVYVSGNLTKNSSYTWNTGTSSWDGLFKTEYTYTSGTLTQDIGYTWDETLTTPDWVYSTKTLYTYTTGLLTSDLSYDWDPIGSTWGVASGKTEYTYGTDMKVASAISSVWDTDLTVWAYSSKSDYTYNTGGKETLVLVSSWSGSAWVNVSKQESEYNDPDGRITLFSYYSWSGSWMGLYRNETSYGVLDLKTYVITIGSGWDFLNSLWTPQSRSTNWYSDMVTGIDLNNTTGTKLSVYPNPVKEFVVFDNVNISGSSRITIFDIQGRKVMEQQLSGNNQVIVSNLRKGLYFYKLSGNGITYSGKLLKN
jgi:hypothetical protein